MLKCLRLLPVDRVKLCLYAYNSITMTSIKTINMEHFGTIATYLHTSHSYFYLFFFYLFFLYQLLGFVYPNYAYKRLAYKNILVYLPPNM